MCHSLEVAREMPRHAQTIKEKLTHHPYIDKPNTAGAAAGAIQQSSGASGRARIVTWYEYMDGVSSIVHMELREAMVTCISKPDK